jgi:hypothetical protein
LSVMLRPIIHLIEAMANDSQLNIIICRENKMKTVTILLMLLALCNQAYGLSFMGPPKADLTQGQYSLGIDYTNGDMELELSGSGVTVDVDADTIFTNLGYGITDEWDGFLRLGFVNVESGSFDGDYEFAYGFGTKFTFAEQGDLAWGGLFQMGWLSGEDTVSGVDIDFDAYEIQFAVGPTVDLGIVSIYGGPFLHFVDGEVEGTIAGLGSATLDLEQESEFGGFIGISAELDQSSDIGIEFLFTGDADAVGVRYVKRF